MANCPTQTNCRKRNYGIAELNSKDYPGYYQVSNPLSKNEYKVVYRGEESPWNFCSCMDFKASRLGTCKHLEAVKLWIETHKKKVYRGIPPYTSVYLSYKDERKVCLRIGSEHANEFKKLAKPYFTEKGEMRPDALFHISDFLREAMKIDNTFRWYPDALDFILDQRDKIYRTKLSEEPSFSNQVDTALKAKLYPYQKEGIRFAFKAGKSIIADEMGLGKTIQALGTAELMRKQGMISSVLIICPTSLKYQWKKEIERFTDSDAIVIEGNHFKRKEQYKAQPFYKIVSYNSLSNDIKLMHSLSTDFLIMDEVQRLKNWNTQISKAARHVESQYAVILSGTPLENKLEELYSVMQFVDQYALGPYYEFIDHTIVKSETGKVIGYKNLNAIGEKLHNILIRRGKKTYRCNFLCVWIRCCLCQ
ncbi:helicase, Snf2 family protein [gut metagenome]|uniref:Helicase, Snf2 family protein n=1 Tax=gut metagenome TaxID=749906 RepID=J9GJ20_9ZZZZ